MMLDDIVSRGRGGPPGQFHDNANGGQNGTVQEIMIPAGKAGLVIGKGGETIKQLQVRGGVEDRTSGGSSLPFGFFKAQRPLNSAGELVP